MESRRNDTVSQFDTSNMGPQLREGGSFHAALNALPESMKHYYFGPSSSPVSEEDCTSQVIEFLFQVAGPARESILELVKESSEGNRRDSFGKVGGDTLVQAERRMERAYRAYRNYFPSVIWDCCRRCCFATMAIDRDEVVLFDEVMRIHEVSQVMHARIGDVNDLIESRRKGVGGSTVAFVMRTRHEREPDLTTDRRQAIATLAKFIAEHLPFLYGLRDSRTGVHKPKQKLCMKAISCIFGVSLNFLYKRRMKVIHHVGRADVTSEADIVTSLLDTAGLRMRQLRRIGSRAGYPEIDKLETFDCGCAEPCFSGASLLRLYEWYNQFKSLAQQLKPRSKETRFLLDMMYCPLLNCTINICNTALSALFTVSESLIIELRRVLQLLCNDPLVEARPLIEETARRYKRSGKHPMNRLPQAVRESVESCLDLVLRADPGATGGVNVCRVYSPEINTHAKLRKALAEHLNEDDVAYEPISISTLQRMVNEYLEERQCSISFKQSDHNACPLCKTMQFSILQFSHEKKLLQRKKERHGNGSCSLSDEDYSALLTELDTKTYQEETTARDLQSHCKRDADIRDFLKKLSDHFRTVENEYIAMDDVSYDWCTRHDHAVLTHQDDMTKVDLPSFVTETTSDITRFRFNVNAHVSAITGDCVVFSHEQGTGAKTGSSIVETILLDHILRCRGESIKIVVSDNAAVGKNWLTTIALPQYIVDQGMADVAMIIYLENNHGKWLADMLFGQLQIRRRRSTIVGIDALLAEFEEINKKSGSVHGFAINPLASVDFYEVFKDLGYEVHPPKDFAFLKRNIHFATACKPGAKERLSAGARKLFGSMLPEGKGLVRISSGPPSNAPQECLPFEERFLDVPAASASLNPDASRDVSEPAFEAPLVVPVDKPYAPSGPGVVSHRTVVKVGYNGFEFRKNSGYEELRSEESIVKEAWPPGLLSTCEIGEQEPMQGSENQKCAPDNWIVRRPVTHFKSSEGEPLARYPPRNLLNAKYKRGPRQRYLLKATSTYQEPPVPKQFWGRGDRIAALHALCDLEENFGRIDQDVNILDLLRSVYRHMRDRHCANDPWLHNRATIADNSAIGAFRDHILLFNAREEGFPRQCITLRIAHKNDEIVKAEVDELHAQHPRISKAKITTELLEKAMMTPGGMDRFEHRVEKDQERFAKEIKNFKGVVRREFDMAHGLLPVPIPIRHEHMPEELAATLSNNRAPR